jgi:hypothetical protein
MLVGLAHPHGDIVFFNYRNNQLAKVAPGIPWRLGNPVSRELIVAPSGRIYIYRGTEELKQRDEKHAVWVYDLKHNQLTNTGFQIRAQDIRLHNQRRTLRIRQFDRAVQGSRLFAT